MRRLALATIALLMMASAWVPTMNPMTPVETAFAFVLLTAFAIAVLE